MTDRQQRVRWERDSEAVVATADEFDKLLDRLAAECGPDSRIITTVDGPGGQSVYFGIGGDLGFVSSCEVPYLTTVGNPEDEGVEVYFFCGHETEIQKRHLVPWRVARRVVREFFDSGRLASDQTWEPA